MCVFLAVLIMAGLVLPRPQRPRPRPAIAVLTTVSAFVPALIPSWDTGPGLGHAGRPAARLARDVGLLHIVRSTGS